MEKKTHKSSKGNRLLDLKSRKIKRQPKRDVLDRIELEIGDTKQPDFKPQAKVMRWDNETNFSIRRHGNYDSAEVVEEDGKIKLKKDKEEVHIYERTDLTEGGFEIDILVKQRPLGNRFKFTIETKDLDFYRQESLTEQEKKDGSHRPEEIVGSYAVYKSKKQANIVNAKKYGAGKVGHIHKPKIYNQNGDWVWGGLEINTANKTLSVVVPQDFIDLINFEDGDWMLVDPTFGYESIGASTLDLENTSGHIGADVAAVALPNANVTQVSAAVSMTSGRTGRYKGLFYTDNSGTPDAYVADTGYSADFLNATAEWVDIDTDIDITAGNYYFGATGVVWNATSSSQRTQLYYDSGGPDYHHSGTDVGGCGGYNISTPSSEDPWCDTSSSTRQLSIYATYAYLGNWVQNGISAVQSDNSSSESFAYDVDAGSDLLVVRSASYGGIGLEDVSTVTYNGVTLTKFLDDNNGSMNVELWYLVNPPSGSNTLVVTYFGSAQHDVVAEDWSGVDTASPERSSDNLSGTNSTWSNDTNITTGEELMLDIFMHEDTGGTWTPDTDQVTDFDQDNSNSVAHIGGSHKIPEDSDLDTMGWTAPGSNSYVHIIAAFNAAPPELDLAVDEIDITFTSSATTESETRSVTYAVLTTDTETRSTSYEVTATDAVTKSLTYAVVTDDVEQRGVIYSVIGDDVEQRDLTYTVITDDSETRSVSYEISTTDSITKSLAYSVVPSILEERDCNYYVLTDDVEQRSVTYEIETTDGITKTLIYQVVTTDDVTKSLQYDISLPVEESETRSLTYAVISDDVEQRSVTYTITSEDSVTRSVAYEVTDTSAITKSINYAVAPATAELRAITYTVVADDSVTRAVEYAVVDSDAITKSSGYYVTSADSETRSGQYTVISDDSETRSATYSIVTTDSQTKGLGYYVVAQASETRDITYNVDAPNSVTKTVQYEIQTTESVTKSVEYTIRTEGVATRSLQYEMIDSNYSRGDEESLPSDDSNAETPYSAADYDVVDEDDETYVCYTGSGYIMHVFKKVATNPNGAINVTWNGKSDYAPSDSTVYLQIYNYDTTSWETVDSDNSTAADTDFTLSGTVNSSVVDYYDGGNVATFRVYQEL